MHRKFLKALTEQQPPERLLILQARTLRETPGSESVLTRPSGNGFAQANPPPLRYSQLCLGNPPGSDRSPSKSAQTASSERPSPDQASSTLHMPWASVFLSHRIHHHIKQHNELFSSSFPPLHASSLWARTPSILFTMVAPTPSTRTETK